VVELLEARCASLKPVTQEEEEEEQGQNGKTLYLLLLFSSKNVITAKFFKMQHVKYLSHYKLKYSKQMRMLFVKETVKHQKHCKSASSTKFFSIFLKCDWQQNAILLLKTTTRIRKIWHRADRGPFGGSWFHLRRCEPLLKDGHDNKHIKTSSQFQVVSYKLLWLS